MLGYVQIQINHRNKAAVKWEADNLRNGIASGSMLILTRFGVMAVGIIAGDLRMISLRREAGWRSWREFK